MSQKEKARAIVQEAFEFDISTALSVDAIIAAAQRAAEGSRKMGIRVVEKDIRKNPGGALSAGYRLKGPGGLMDIMVIMITGVPQAGGRTLVSLKVGDFLFKKGSLGFKPTINGHNVVAKFVAILKTELAAG